MNKNNNMVKNLSIILLEFAIVFFIAAIYFLIQENSYYSVIFNDNGIIVKSIKVKKNKMVSLPSEIKKDGYLVDKWYLGTKEYDFNNKVTNNIVIDIVWKEISQGQDKKEYTVTFNTNGGSSIDSVKVFENDKITKPQDPKKDNYEFIEWQLNGQKYDFDNDVTGDVELVAIWKEVKQQETTNPSPSPSTKPTESPKPSTNPSPSPSTKPTESPKPSTNPSPSPSTKPTESPKPSTNPSPSQSVTPIVKNYTIKISQVDAYSPDCYLTVYENETAISVKKITYSDGVSISASINGNKITVAKSDIEGETSFKVTLNDNSTVIAKIN